MKRKIRATAFFLFAFLLLIFVDSAYKESDFAVLSPDLTKNAVEMSAVAVSGKDGGEKVYLGGFPLGFNVKADGVIVVSRVEIDTFAGRVLPSGGVQEGDIIKELNGNKIKNISDIVNIMSGYKPEDKLSELVVYRGGQEKKVTSNPVIEYLTGIYRLGLEVRDCVQGIGTVTYVKENGQFGSLGHSIYTFKNSSDLPSVGGAVYECKLSGITKGSRGNPGEIKGSFSPNAKPDGFISRSNRFGVYGTLYNIPETELYETAPRSAVRPGKAKIVSTLSETREMYDIEIIKANSQKDASEKGMIVRVTDKRLIKGAGGILQGMSGSPIIQNGKLVGALTHVLINDCNKGYGVYIDFMLENHD